MAIGKALKGAANIVGEVSATATNILGDAVIKTAKGGYGFGKKVSKPLFRTLEKGSEELIDAGLGGKLINKRLTMPGLVTAGVGSAVVSTVGAINNSGGANKASKLGSVSAGENLDRLISYDGSGFINNFGEITQGDPEVMQDVVKNTFTSPNQFGATGDLVFALHNRREG